MNRKKYILYQIWLKILHQKKKYLLYVLSFYVGLLLPAFCLANIRSVDRVFYFTTFHGMKNTVQIDWFGKKFEEFSDENMNCFIKAYQEEDFTEWNHKYVSVIGIDENYAYPIPDLDGRMFHEQEMKDGAMVCLLDMQCAKEHGYQPGDSLMIHGKQYKIIGIMDSSIYSGIVIPYRTMKKLYQNDGKIQFTGTFFIRNGQAEDVSNHVMKWIADHDPNAELISMSSGVELYDNAVRTKDQWRLLRLIIAGIALLFFLLNESIVIIEKVENERGMSGVNMAVGASGAEIKVAAFGENVVISLCAAVLVLLTMNPLAKMFALDNVIVLDRVVVIEMAFTAFMLCGILTWCSMRRMKLYQISYMLKIKETE